MKTSINKYPTLLYPNNRPINSFVNKCINNDRKVCGNICKIVYVSNTNSTKESIEKWDQNVNGTINNEEMAEAFVCNHKYNRIIYTKDIFSIKSSITGYSIASNANYLTALNLFIYQL